MSGQANDSTSIPNVAAHSAEQISAETIEKCAGLLAVGEMDWPEGLSDQQEAELLIAVRRHRRVALVKFIASRIAADIACEARSGAKEAQR